MEKQYLDKIKEQVSQLLKIIKETEDKIGWDSLWEIIQELKNEILEIVKLFPTEDIIDHELNRFSVINFLEYLEKLGKIKKTECWKYIEEADT